MTANATVLRTKSETVRPISTADWLMGSERSRSIRPFCMSSATPAPVKLEPNSTVWANIPGSRYCW